MEEDVSVQELGRYERLGDQHANSKQAARILAGQMRRSRLGQLPEDLGNKILTVTKAVEAGAAALEKPKAPTAAAPASVSIDIPYVPIGLAVLAVVGIFLFLRKK